MLDFVVKISENDMRIDKFLSIYIKDISRVKIQDAILNGAVSVDGQKITDCSKKLKAEQLVNFDQTYIVNEQIELKPEKVDFSILYEDDDLIVLNKPSGIVVHPGNGNWSGTLVNGLLAYSDLSSGTCDFRPGIVHRIDKDTSGSLVIAKNDFIHAKLAEQFAEHSITRRYICYTYGKPNINLCVNENGLFRYETKFGRDPVNRKKMKVLQDRGKTAITLFNIEQIFSKSGVPFASKIMCELKTGRTHQIRVHMASLGASLIGDQVYGKRKKLPIENKECVFEFNRQALHAYYLKFEHPRNKCILEFVAPIPDDLTWLESQLMHIK